MISGGTAESRRTIDVKRRSDIRAGSIRRQGKEISPFDRNTVIAAVVLFIVVATAAITSNDFLAGSASADTASLVPNEDVANPEGWENNDGTGCGGGGTACSSRVDEDVDAADDSDHIRSVFNPDDADLLLGFTDSPSNLGIITELQVRFRAYKEGPAPATALVGIAEAGLSGLIGTPSQFALTNIATEYSYTITGINVLPADVDGLLAWVRADVSGAGPTTRVIVTSINADATFTAVAPNPPLGGACGLDVALVIDSSSSIDATELAQTKTAFKGFVNAFLPATDTEMAVVEFNASATVLQGFTSDATILENAIDSATTVALTNWDDALYDARTLFPNRAHADVIVFASDGFPNSIGGHEAEPLGLFIGQGPAMNRALLEANAAKTAGIRIIALGIGIDVLDVANLQIISSADATITTDFAGLANSLADLAAELCPTSTPTPTPTGSPTPTPTPTEPLTATPTPTEPLTATPTPTEPLTATPTPTEPLTATPTPTEPLTATPTPTEPLTATPTPTEPLTATPTPTEPPTATPTPTEPPTPTPTQLAETATPVAPTPTEPPAPTPTPLAETATPVAPTPSPSPSPTVLPAQLPPTGGSAGGGGLTLALVAAMGAAMLFAGGGLIRLAIRSR